MDLDDAETTMRTADGQLSRDRIAVKRAHDIAWPPMRGDDLSIIMKMLKPEFIKITYADPEEGTYVSKMFYAGNRKTEVLFERNGVLWWGPLSVTLTEQ